MTATTELEPTELSAHIETELPSSAAPKFYTYYHAGPLFNLAELTSNTLLAHAISNSSNANFVPVLPQDLEQRDTSPHSIRDQDIRALLSCDLALFTYDGTELDSGTVVEFMFAKMADIPVVILRTDFRGAGDQHQGPVGKRGDPWNLMSSFYPRTETVVVDAMVMYKTGLGAALRHDIGADEAGRSAGEQMRKQTADAVVAAFERVLKKPAVMPKESKEAVYSWLAVMPNLRDGGHQNVTDMLNICADKTAKGLL